MLTASVMYILLHCNAEKEKLRMITDLLLLLQFISQAIIKGVAEDVSGSVGLIYFPPLLFYIGCISRNEYQFILHSNVLAYLPIILIR